MNDGTRKCQNCQGDFMIEPDDFDFYKKIDVPPPTWCPECRLRRRLEWRNERALYHRTCGLCGKNIISMYAPEKPFVVYCRECWYSDKWDPLDYGAAFDFTKPFFEQYRSLQQCTPMLALSNYNSTNCEYANFVDQNKNGYLVFGSGLSENIYYTSKAVSVKDGMDLLSVNKSELMYECVNCFDSYNLRFSKDSKSCTDSWFLDGCRSCSNCFGCANLIGKSYCFFNVQLSKDEYAQKLSALDLGGHSALAALKKKFREEIYPSAIHRYANIVGSVNCTGDNINNSKNCRYGFDVFRNAEDSKYLFSALDIKDAWDGMGQYKNNFSYENLDNDEGDHNIGTMTIYHSHNAFYSFNCHDSSDLFGCIGTRKKSYCILNRQYSKEEYVELLPKIRSQMDEIPYVSAKKIIYKFGEFFPEDLSPFAYNETLAQEYFPLAKDEALAFGYRWRDPDERNYRITKKPAELPEHISEVDESILGEVIGCMHEGKCSDQCTTAFKIISQEFQFYRRMNLPLPRLCSNCRHYERLRQRNPLSLWHRTCACRGEKSERDIYANTISHFHGETPCPNEFETPYAPERSEIVYCEQCYQAEVA